MPYCVQFLKVLIVHNVVPKATSRLALNFAALAVVTAYLIIVS
jgi:hypothetical protein